MTGRKQKKQEERLSKPVTFRLTAHEHQQLEALRKRSDYHSIGELLRRRLAGKPVRVFHRDTSHESLLEELAAIRHELKLIGVNINQVTRHFHGSQQAAHKVMLVQQVLTQYREVDSRVGLLLTLISQLSKKW